MSHRDLDSRRRAIRHLAAFVAASPFAAAQFIPRSEHWRVPALDEIANVLEFEPVARAKLTQAAYDYVAGGVENEVTLRRNREAFDWVSLLPRLEGAGSDVDLSCEILGQPMESPLLVSPTAGHQQIHPDGEMETHRGATAANVTMIVSNNASYPLDQIAAAATGPLWSQLYVHGDTVTARERIDKSVEAGCKAICLTVDAQYRSQRERLTENQHLAAQATPPPRRSARASRARPRPGADNPYGIGADSTNQDWSFVDTLRTWSNLPVLVKGLLTGEDAKRALEHGAAGIVVSNHGARYLEYAPSTIEVLPEIVDAAGGKLTILIDSGFRRGSDVAKALALGANGVCVGRPPLWGLGAYGSAGVTRVLEILKAELRHTIGGLGAARLADLSRTQIRTDFP